MCLCQPDSMTVYKSSTLAPSISSVSLHRNTTQVTLSSPIHWPIAFSKYRAAAIVPLVPFPWAENAVVPPMGSVMT